jgi:hypothetical protein
MYQRFDVLLDIPVRLWGFGRIHLDRYAFDADSPDHTADRGFEEGLAVPSHEKLNSLGFLKDEKRWWNSERNNQLYLGQDRVSPEQCIV